MFREGSNVAIHIIDNIVFEAAGLVYKELKFVAEKLLKDTLWKSFSSKSTGNQVMAAQEGIHEMIRLTKVRPLSQVLGNNFTSAFPEIATLLGSDSGINWTACCMCMNYDPAFSPSWSLEGGVYVTNIFFVEPEDVFLLLGVNVSGALVRSDLVEKDDSVTLERRQIAMQKFFNFLFHYIWRSL
jgi:hypothetical protein